MAERSLLERSNEAERGVEALVAEAVAPALKGVDPARQVDAATAERLAGLPERGLPTGGSVERIRVYAPNGTLLASSDAEDMVGDTTVGQIDLIRAAAAGAIASTPGQEPVGGGDPQVLEVYAPLEPGRTSRVAIGVDVRYRPILAAASRPWESIQLGGAIAAVVFLTVALFLLARAITARSLAARSGFGGANVTRTAPRTTAKESRAQRDLEHQLDEVREQLRAREEESAEAAQQFASQLQELSRRLEEARAQAREAVVPPQPPVETEELVRARGRAEAAERSLAEANDTIRGFQEREAAAADLERRAGEAGSALDRERQRAAATEDARSALEARLAAAQARVEELEARPRIEVDGVAARPAPHATDGRVAELERELEAMGEALEQSQMRARRAYADAESVRAQLEAATPRGGLSPDAAAAEEIQRLRVELGQAIERANAAETHASRLQADLAEARAGAYVPADDGLEPGADEGDEGDDHSLRFRLARSAARKKGLDGDQMWS